MASFARRAGLWLDLNLADGEASVLPPAGASPSPHEAGGAGGCQGWGARAGGGGGRVHGKGGASAARSPSRRLD